MSRNAFLALILLSAVTGVLPPSGGWGAVTVLLVNAAFAVGYFSGPGVLRQSKAGDRS